MFSAILTDSLEEPYSCKSVISTNIDYHYTILDSYIMKIEQINLLDNRRTRTRGKTQKFSSPRELANKTRALS